jgi:hypothetical protein
MELDGLVKLGFSKNPDIRKYAVRRDVSGSVRLAFKIPVENMARCEAAVHERLKEKRAHGEWFTVTLDEAIECLKWAAENPKAVLAHPVCFRLDPEDMALLDEVRGNKSRAEFAKEVTLAEVLLNDKRA